MVDKVKLELAIWYKPSVPNIAESQNEKVEIDFRNAEMISHINNQIKPLAFKFNFKSLSLRNLEDVSLFLQPVATNGFRIRSRYNYRSCRLLLATGMNRIQSLHKCINIHLYECVINSTLAHAYRRLLLALDLWKFRGRDHRVGLFQNLSPFCLVVECTVV